MFSFIKTSVNYSLPIKDENFLSILKYDQDNSLKEDLEEIEGLDNIYYDIYYGNFIFLTIFDGYDTEYTRNEINITIKNAINKGEEK